jgi:hypothetical protein
MLITFSEGVITVQPDNGSAIVLPCCEGKTYAKTLEEACGYKCPLYFLQFEVNGFLRTNFPTTEQEHYHIRWGVEHVNSLLIIAKLPDGSQFNTGAIY